MEKRISIGISDFEKLIDNHYYYVDSSRMIADIYRESANIILLTRPRRFGKTLNMSMLYYFFDNESNRSNLFKGLYIAEDAEVMKEINDFPVIFITFKDINNNNWQTTSDKLRSLFAILYEKNKDRVFDSLSDFYQKRYLSIIDGTASDAVYQESLKDLTGYLHNLYNKPVLLLIDEYDVPIQSGWLHGYYDDVVDFMRGLLSGALKDNPFLFKGILTGIYRVAKESIFSGLNNLKVYSLFDEKYSEYFGFTEDEVEWLFQSLEIADEDLIKNLKAWYNGYDMGNQVIYNPWSVLNYLVDKKLKPYWINTSSNDLIIRLIENNLKEDVDFRHDIEELISGNSIAKMINEASSLRDIDYDMDAIWTLFLFSGYLRPENVVVENGKYKCQLKVPNKEIMIFFQDTVINWIKKASKRTLYSITDSLINGDAGKFCEKLEKYVMETLSYYDIQSKPENTYHLILLGMFAHLVNDYWIKSNRESGLGRYDICLKAKNKKNYSAIIEIKSEVGKTTDAMRQIIDKAYAQELESEGYTKIMKIALGVDGKKIKTIAVK